jgi:hypothetical protein
MEQTTGKQSAISYRLEATSFELTADGYELTAVLPL